MLENYLAELSFGEKRSLKEGVQNGFPGGEIGLNRMTFVYDEASGLVTVHDLIVGEGNDGLQLPLADFVTTVHTVTAEVPLYANEAEEVEALRRYLQELSADDQLLVRLRLHEVKEGYEVVVPPLEFLYDDETGYVSIDVRQLGSQYALRDALFLPWGVFVGEVGAV